MAETLPPALVTEIAKGAAAVADPLDQPRNLQELLEIEQARDAERAAAEPPAPAPEKKKEPKKLSKDDLSNVTDLLGQQLLHRQPKKEDKKEEPKPDPAPAPKAKADPDPAAPVAEDDKAKLRTRKKAPDFDPIAIAAETGRAIAAELSQKPEPAPRAPAPSPADDLLPEEREELIVFQEMERMNPTYKNLSADYVTSIKRIESYRQKWEKDNPGEDFDPDAEAHDDFYARVSPKFNQRDFRKAEARLAGRELVKEVEAKSTAESASLKAELAVKDLAPAIHDARIAAAASILKAINPAHLDLVEKEGFKKFSETDPTAAEALQIAAQRISPFIEAARQIDEPKARIPIDMKNPAHAEYINYLVAKEEEMKRRPIRQQIDEDGRRFATRQELLAMPLAQRRQFWFFNDELLIQQRVEEETTLAKKFIESEGQKLERLAKLRGWKIDSAAPPAQSKTTEPKADPAEPAPVKSPEARGGAKLDDTVDPDAKVDNEFSARIAAVLFPR